MIMDDDRDQPRNADMRSPYNGSDPIVPNRISGIKIRIGFNVACQKDLIGLFGKVTL